MANQPTYSFTDDDGKPPRTSFDEHERTYAAFLSIPKWSMATVAFILILLAVFLL